MAEKGEKYGIEIWKGTAFWDRCGDLEKAVKIYEEELGIGPWKIESASPFFDDKLVNDGVGLNIRTAIFRETDMRSSFAHRPDRAYLRTGSISMVRHCIM